MPWMLVGQCVHKKNLDGTPGEQVKCHPSVEAAKEHMAALYANMPMNEKAGRRHNARDVDIIASVHDMGGKLQQAALDLGHEVPIVVQTIAAKAGGLPDAAEPAPITGVVKAAGEYELDVLANPYGGPNGGKDSDGEFFSPRTKFHEEQIPNPPAVYYHGYGDDRRPMGLPEWIGKTVRRWVDERGVWYRVQLNRANKYAQRVWDAAQRGAAFASTGVVLASHRVDKLTGEILSWLNGEISLFETDSGKRPANGYAVALPAMKAVFEQAGLTLPDFDSPTQPQTDTTGPDRAVAVAPGTSPRKNATEKIKMELDEKELASKIAATVAAAMKAERDAEAVEAERKRKEDERVAELVRAAEEKVRQEYAKANRLPMGDEAPKQSHFADTRKYDGLNVDDMAFMVGLLDSGKRSNGQRTGVTKSAARALAIKLAEDKATAKHRNGAEFDLGEQGRFALKAHGLDPADVLHATKSDELNYSTQVGYGDEWVVTANSDRLWEAVRAEAVIVDKIPEITVPQGAESIKIPLEGADPTWYKVAQTTDNNATTGRPDATVTASKLATDNETLTVAKMGARTVFSGELEEDSIIPWVPQLRRQLIVSGAETLEHVVIDGDTDATNSTNINAIDTTPAATAVYLLTNGFRKSPLVTTTANSTSAGGTLADTTFLAVLKLMGTAGMNGADMTKVEFILDPNTYWKALELTNLKTIQTFQNATLENGVLTRVWGYPVRRSYNFHKTSAKRMANSAGKVDADTDSNNTLGAILAVRYDQWLFGYKRRMTIETQRFIDADATQIVALCRVGLLQRDTEASAIAYNVGV